MADPTDIEIRRAMWDAYQRQRNSAKSRNILWLFDFDSWCAFWIASGKWHERGRSKSKFVMARSTGNDKEYGGLTPIVRGDDYGI